MKFYNQSELFKVLVSAAERPGFVPDPDLQRQYNKNRLARAIQALKSKNLFIYTEGSRPTTDLNSTTTIYTQPVGHRMMLIGYSENFRYGRIFDSGPAGVILDIALENAGTGYSLNNELGIAGGDGEAIIEVTAVDGSGAITGFTLTNAGSGYSVGNGIATVGGAGAGATVNILSVSPISGPVDKVWQGEHRVRIIGGANERALVADLVPSQAGVSGENRYTSPILTVPEIIEANEQIAVDLGYDTAMVIADTPAAIVAQAFVFFCLKVKNQLTQQDIEAIEDVKRYIEANYFQKGQYLNCVSLGQQSVHFNSAVAGGIASCDTRTITAPMLITGIGTNLVASKLKITDTGDGSSFSLDKFMQVSSLNMPDYEAQGAQDLGAPVSAPLWTNYFQFPVPHLLRGGSQLHVDVVNGGDQGLGAGSVVDPQDGQVIVFQGITV